MERAAPAFAVAFAIFYVLAFRQHGACRQPRQLFGQMLAVQIRRADFDQAHAELAR